MSSRNYQITSELLRDQNPEPTIKEVRAECMDTRACALIDWLLDCRAKSIQYISEVIELIDAERGDRDGS